MQKITKYDQFGECGFEFLGRTRTRREACSKKCFDRVGAMLAIAEAGKTNKRREQRMYWCSICQAFHLTSQKKRR